MKWMWVAALCVASVAHAQTQWKLATGYSPESFHTQNIQAFVREVDAATSGRVKIEVRAGGELIKLPDILKAVQERRVEMGETIMTNMVADLPVAGADAVPFVVKSYDDAKRMWASQRPLIEQDFAVRGLRVLYAVPWPPQGLYARTALERPSDLRGLSMRTYNASTVRIAEMLGARPVNVPMAEVSAALAAGKVDAMITSAVTGVENQVWGSIRYYYPINAWFPKNLVFMNRGAFESLEAQDQAALLEAAKRAEVRGWAMSQQQEAAATAELKRRGIAVERLPSQFTMDFKRLGEKFSLEWLRTVGNDANQIFIPYYSTR
jgi:TRAP-type C4-dicarboxylate transport system substrate-binding protein